MSDWTVHLAFDEGTSSKFWRARVDGKTLYVNYGKLGSNGQTQVKDLGDPDAAQAEYDKLVREKRKKGYRDLEAGPPAAGAAPDDDGDAGADDDDEPVTVVAKRLPGKPVPPSKPTAAPVAKPPTTSAAATPGHRMVLDAGSRKVDTTLYLDGATLRMDSRETYATPDAAKKAFDRLKKMLGGEGYKDR